MTDRKPSIVLVVDDHEAVRYARSRALRRAGYEVLEAATGRDAMSQLQERRPDLVILDVHLPDMSGLDVCRTIKSDPRTAIIPVVHMSATSISAPDQVRGLEGGADGYLVEPVPAEVLVATVGAMVRMYRAEHSERKTRRTMEILVGNLPGAAYRSDSPGGPLTFVSFRVLELIGLAAAELLGRPNGWWDRIHPGDLGEVRERAAQAIATGSAFESTYRVVVDGVEKWVSDRAIPVTRESGGDPTWEGFASDVTELKLAQEVIARDQERLRLLVDEKTEELRRSHERLRVSERLAAMGTLAAGLGHDMGNLLLPLNFRIDALKGLELPASAAEDVTAIGNACDYLRKLSGGLRLLSVDPSAGASAASTELHDWAIDALPLLRSILPKQLTLLADIPETPCWLRIGKTAFTQAIFNLVQNAGDAMRTQGRGTVRISVERSSGSFATIRVADDGPGMSEEVRTRCMEPFFTTKARGMSTGLGLSLVYGLVRDVGGSLDIQSALGAGTTFVMQLPQSAPPTRNWRAIEPRKAVLDLQDTRMRAIFAEELRRISMEIAPASHASADDASLLLVTDNPDLANRRSAPSLVLAGPTPSTAPTASAPHTLALGRNPRIQIIRHAINQIVRQEAYVGEPLSPVNCAPPLAGAVSLLCVDDNETVSAAVQDRLAVEPGFRWLGSLPDTSALLSVIQRESPDLALLDVDMAGRSPFESLAEIAPAFPACRFVMYSGHVRKELVERAIDCGAWGYAAKHDGDDALIACLRSIASGNLGFSPLSWSAYVD